jgi:tripartite-type tricarboxylate transporter receptor subunit TctC
VLAKLNTATNEFLNTPSATQMFANLGLVVGGGTPEELRSFIAAEMEKWGPIIKAANISF